MIVFHHNGTNNEPSITPGHRYIWAETGLLFNRVSLFESKELFDKYRSGRLSISSSWIINHWGYITWRVKQ